MIELVTILAAPVAAGGLATGLALGLMWAATPTPNRYVRQLPQSIDPEADAGRLVDALDEGRVYSASILLDGFAIGASWYPNEKVWCIHVGPHVGWAGELEQVRAIVRARLAGIVRQRGEVDDG